MGHHRIRALLLFSGAVLIAAAQQPSAFTYRDAPADLDAGMVELAVVDAESGRGVRHPLLCMRDSSDHWAVADENGVVRIGNLARATLIRVEALGYRPDSVSLDPSAGRRRAAVLRLRKAADTRSTLECLR